MRRKGFLKLSTYQPKFRTALEFKVQLNTCVVNWIEYKKTYLLGIPLWMMMIHLFKKNHFRHLGSLERDSSDAWFFGCKKYLYAAYLFLAHLTHSLRWTPSITTIISCQLWAIFEVSIRSRLAPFRQHFQYNWNFSLLWRHITFNILFSGNFQWHIHFPHL